MRIMDESVKELMKNNDGYGIHLELTTPEKLVMGVLVKPEEIFSYNTSISKCRCDTCLLDGEYQLCMKISEPVFSDVAGIKSVKTKLFFSNEYYNSRSSLIDQV